MPDAPRRASIYDIAHAAGVSITTVSHALNGKGRIQPTTRERVLRTAEELGYSANVHARRLASGRHMTVALQVAGTGRRVITPDTAYYVDLLNGAAAAALDANYTPVLVPSGIGEADVATLAVDGALIIDPQGTEPLLRHLRERGRPVTTAGRVLDGGADVASVDNDHRTLTVRALDHLEEAGYRRPALLTGPAGRSYAADAADAYREWAGARGTEPLVSHVRSPPSAAVALKAAEALLDRPEPPDGVYAAFDVFALGLLRAAAQRGLRVPADLGIVATVDSEALRSVHPPVSAFDLHPGRIGRAAVDLLVGMLDRGEEPSATLVPARLRARGSTGVGPDATG